MSTPALMYSPPSDVRDKTEIGRFVRWLESERGLRFDDYHELLRWSVDDLEGFWGAVWDFFGVRAATPYERVLADDSMPGAVWFPGARLNYAEHLLGTDEDLDKPAVVADGQTRDRIELTFGDLRAEVARVRAGLKELGVGPGDRVVAYLPNIPETLIAFAATASIGAIWASCAPELGARAVIDRLGQLEPDVLLAVAGYGYRDKQIDRRGELETIRAALPTLRQVVDVPYGTHTVPDAMAWEELRAHDGPLEFDPVPFDHPLFVLFSSGTTGKPKAIVHGHGGILLEQYKANGFMWDMKPGGRLHWFSTTSWMMWNALVSALLTRTSIVMLDGDPAWPDFEWQWRLADELKPTCMGAAPAFVMACRKAGLNPGRHLDLTSIEVFVTAGSPLPPEGYRWLGEQLAPGTLLLNGSGGTDVCSGIVGGNPMLPVWEGEMSGPNLGVAARAYDPDGNPIVGELGELVIERPMPSMPVALWGDEDGSRLRAAYFEDYPGVWRHGDWIRFTERGSCVITGRSDATLNRGGVRLGTAELYGVVEELPQVADSLVVHLEDESGGAGELLLFVVPAEGAEVDEELREAIAGGLRAELSPRHVPDKIVAVPAIPYTLTGKKLEAPVKRIMRGSHPDDVASPDALKDPESLDAFAQLAAARASAARS
jgi:acetoacetyl-CoA synthetase